MATIQIRNVPADVHRTLRTRAAAAGQSLQEFLLEEVIELAGTRDFLEILAEVDAEREAHPERFAAVSSELIAQIIREDRDSH